MNRYVKIIFPNVIPEQSDLLVAYLGNVGFDGFEERQALLLAYCSIYNYNEEVVKAITQSLGVNFEKEILNEINWNSEWERNFQPIVVDKFCGIRAQFHPAFTEVDHELIITPKMSFGTGHHATTYMMIQWMKKIDHINKKIFDFGTGTGVLAILAEKLGALEVKATDNDDWSILNAAENIANNRCQKITLHKSDSLDFTEKFDIILANINKQVLLAKMGLLQQHLEREGVLIISGILEGDLGEIEASASVSGLIVTGHIQKIGWVALKLTHY